MAMVSTHNIRRPALWLVCTCLLAIAYFLLTDPRAGLFDLGANNPVDAVAQAELGTLVGLAGAGVILLVALFLCTRKGSPPTMEPAKAK